MALICNNFSATIFSLVIFGKPTEKVDWLIKDLAEQRDNMQIVIYINEKPLIIHDQENEPPKAWTEEKKLLRLTEPPLEKLPALPELFEGDGLDGALIQTAQPDKVKAAIFAEYDCWQAAGGLITNPEEEILLMFRRGKWDLPKGKLDPGETIEACALREVTEETGLKNVHIEKKLVTTFHTYHLSDGRAILKQTHWFKMNFTGTELTVPQIEEDILDIQWVRKINLEKYLQYSYPNIREVFVAAGYTPAQML